jgi:hypothetical protein
VRLHFSENWWSLDNGTCDPQSTTRPCKNQRLFDVKLEDKTVLSRFDIYTAAGAPYKALIKTFQTTVGSDGKLDIDFAAVVRKETEYETEYYDNAKIDAIEVLPAPNFWKLPTTNAAIAGATGNILTKYGTSNVWDSGAYSVKSIPSGKNGYVEFQVGTVGTTQVCGLSRSTDVAGVDPLKIDFSLSFFKDASGNSYFRIYENGQSPSGTGQYSYTGADKFRVAVENGKVKYYKNYASGATPLYQSQIAPTYPLFVDASLLTGSALKASIKNATLVVTTPPSTGGQGLVETPLEIE